MGDRKYVSVVYSLIFFVYSSSIGWFGSGPGLAIASSCSVNGLDGPGFAFGAFGPCAATSRRRQRGQQHTQRQTLHGKGHSHAQTSAPGIVLVSAAA